MPTSPQGYEAWVEVDGNKVTEYQPERHKTHPQSRCWIPCNPGKEFKIGFRLPAALACETNHTIQIRLDGTGTALRSNTFPKLANGDLAEATVQTRYFDEHRVHDNASRKFMFGKLELTDDESETHLEAAKLGEIKVTVLTVEKYAQMNPNSVQAPILEDYKAYEGAKKGVTHCVRFGQETFVPGAPERCVRSVNTKDAYVFRFIYRDMGVLMANGIAPRPASVRSPAPAAASSSSSSSSSRSTSGSVPPTKTTSAKASGKRKADEVKVEEEEEPSENEDEEADEEIRALEAQLAALRARPNRRRSRSAKRVKREIKQETASLLVHGEVIDLTDLDLKPTLRRGVVKKEPRKSAKIGEIIDLTL